jgi:Spy/CpxP family protein refolding chaperone
MMHHPALGMLMAESSEVGLTAEQQKVVDAIEADLEKQADALKEPHTQLNTDLADGVAAGKLDKKKIDADSKKLALAGDATVKAVQDAANKLHQTLDATQRKKLSELLVAKADEMHEHMGPMHGPGPGPKGEPGKGPQGPQGAPPPPPKGELGAGPKGPDEHARHHGQGKPEMGHPGMGPDKLVEMLGLTQEQNDKLKTKLEALSKSQAGSMKTEHAAMQQQMKAIAEAFATDKFDAKKAGIGEKHGDMMKAMIKSRLDFIEAVLSVLTPEQRTKFAEHVRQQAGESEAAE